MWMPEGFQGGGYSPVHSEIFQARKHLSMYSLHLCSCEQEEKMWPMGVGVGRVVTDRSKEPPSTWGQPGY